MGWVDEAKSIPTIQVKYQFECAFVDQSDPAVLSLQESSPSDQADDMRGIKKNETEDWEVQRILSRHGAKSII